MRFSEFPFLRYFFFILSGVILGAYFPKEVKLYLLVFIALLWSVYLLFLFQKRVLPAIFPILSYGLLLSFGIFLQLNYSPDLEESILIKGDGESLLLTKALEYDLQKPNSFENLLEIVAIKEGGVWKPQEGKVLVYHQSEEEIEPGQVLLIRGSPERIEPPSNPEEFDYKGYMARQGISYRQFLGQNSFVRIKGNSEAVINSGKKLRRTIRNRIQQDISDLDAQQVAEALLLGEKKSLDRQTRDSYSQAGVMHVLAVSGLHVGIIYGLFFFISELLKLQGQKKRIYFLLVVLIIWSYAFLTGFSPSVIRASTMFSLITLGQLRDRKTSIINILAFSATLMICFNPDVIYEVGFQLSYIAVLGIVLLQPLILRWWLPPNQVLDYFWKILSVSIAAQLVTFPLTVYYFHSFPTYFMLGNLLILPLAFLIMQVGVPWIVLGTIPWFGNFLGKVLNFLIGLQNSLIEVINQLPGGKLDRLSISWESMLFIWFSLLLWALWHDYSRKKILKVGLMLMILWTGIHVTQIFFSDENEVILYSNEKGILVDVYNEDSYYSFNWNYPPKDISYGVDPYRIQRGVGLIPEDFSALESQEGNLFFPSLGFSFEPELKQIKFTEESDYDLAIWDRGHWASIESTDSLILKWQALRILF